MKRFCRIPLWTVIFVFAFLLGHPKPGWSDPSIEVVPSAHDFGNVEVGTVSTAMITIGNFNGHILVVSNVFFQGGSSPDFYLPVPPLLPMVIQPGAATEIEIGFSSSATGDSTATLAIESNDPDNSLVLVHLSGRGVEQEPPPPTSIAEILAFIDASVAEGTLFGAGPGHSAGKRLNALRNMIKAAGDLIEDGLIEQACQQLMVAYKKCDGLAPPESPPDFVAGPHASQLAVMIQNLRISLGCE